MLMIKEMKKNKGAVTLKLDGRIEGLYMPDLERICERYRRMKNSTILLDFTGVTYIDDDGLESLMRIRDDRVEIVNCSPFIRALLNNAHQERPKSYNTTLSSKGV